MIIVIIMSLYLLLYEFFLFSCFQATNQLILENHTYYFYLKITFIISFESKYHQLSMLVLFLIFEFLLILASFMYLQHFNFLNTILQSVEYLSIYLLDYMNSIRLLKLVELMLVYHRIVLHNEMIKIVYLPNFYKHLHKE